MKNFQRPIEKLKEDVRFYQTQLVEAKIQHKHALSSGSDLLAKRLENRIHYFERRIAVSRTELSRMQALYDMSPKDQLVARLIHANKFDMNRRDVRSLSEVEVTKGLGGSKKEAHNV